MNFRVEHGFFAKFFLDFEEAVVFGRAVGAAEGAGFDLAATVGHGQVGDGGVFGFPAAVGHDGSKVIGLGEVDGFYGFGEGANLVGLDEDGIGDRGVDPAL